MRRVLAVLLLVERPTLPRAILWSGIGLVGVYIVNVVRLVTLARLQRHVTLPGEVRRVLEAAGILEADLLSRHARLHAGGAYTTTLA